MPCERTSLDPLWRMDLVGSPHGSGYLTVKNLLQSSIVVATSDHFKPRLTLCPSPPHSHHGHIYPGFGMGGIICQMVQGTWTHQDFFLYINILEVRAILLALQDFQDCFSWSASAVHSNMSVVSYIRIQGRGSRSCPMSGSHESLQMGDQLATICHSNTLLCLSQLTSRQAQQMLTDVT